MKIEDQVCSLNLAQRLKELKSPQNSHLFHYNEPYEDGEECFVITNWEDYETTYDSKGEPFSAYSVPELMELIPPFIDTKNNEPFNNYRFDLQRSVVVEDKKPIPIFFVNYHCDTFQVDSGSPFFALKLIKNNLYDAKLADCLAKLLIYLMENGYMEIAR